MKRDISFLWLVAVLAVFSGCAPVIDKPIDPALCPGKPNIAAAVRTLALQRQNVQPFVASADCTLSWREEDGDEKDEHVPGKLAFVPPAKIFFKGDKFGEVRFGTNETEFWLRVKPELDSYWYGSKAQARSCDQVLLIDPANIAEALGVVDVTTGWQLSYRDGFDILDFRAGGKRKKRVYVNTCDYRIELIEYFDDAEMKKITVELNNYTTGSNGLVIPSEVRIAAYDEMGLEVNSALLKLKNPKLLPPEKQGKKLFVRPPRDGYKNVYKLSENCEFVPVD